MKRASGFTLIEISIVLVIIGLVIGGVLVGKDLIKAFEHRQMVTKLEAIGTAFNAFSIKYNCLPGDCVNATSIGLTDNGDGNGKIAGPEPAYALQHLAQAGFLVLDTNPTLGALIGADYISQCDEGMFITQQTQDLTFPLSGTFAGCAMSQAGMIGKFGSCRDMLAFDQKYDDGKPATGRIVIIPEENLDSGNYCVFNAADPQYDTNAVPPFNGLHTLFFKF